MTSDDDDSGWDNLAEELGVAPAEKKPVDVPPPPVKKPALHRPEPEPEPEFESEEFGASVAEEEAPLPVGALYDPGPDAMSDDEGEFDDAGAENGENGDGEETGEPQEGGKKKRRRRRRKKKGGGANPEAAAPAAAAEDDEAVEQGEAPAEVEDDDEEDVPMHSAVDEEMEEAVAGPRPEWHVMTWVELVSKLHRPG